MIIILRRIGFTSGAMAAGPGHRPTTINGLYLGYLATILFIIF